MKKVERKGGNQISSINITIYRYFFLEFFYSCIKVIGIIVYIVLHLCVIVIMLVLLQIFINNFNGCIIYYHVVVS